MHLKLSKDAGTGRSVKAAATPTLAKFNISHRYDVAWIKMS